MILTEEQQIAIYAAKEFIMNGKPDEYFLIDGKAGTGKTTIASEIVKQFKNKRCAVAALSHKAKFVIMDKFQAQQIDAEFFSLAGLLGMKYDFDTGTFSARARYIPILDYDLIIIDEASMINEEALEMIMNEKRKTAKVLFLGDIGQLPPIRDSNSPYYHEKSDLFGLKSPVFATKNKATLHTRIRQGEDSPILPYADYYWNNSVKEFMPVLEPCTDATNIITNKGALLFSKTIKELSDILVKAYQNAVEASNPNHVKIIVYRNEVREALNQAIHKRIFPNSEGLCAGDLIIFNGRCGDIENATEGQITNVGNITKDDYGVYYVPLSIRIPRIKDLQIVDYALPQSRATHKRIVSGLFSQAKKLQGSSDYYSAIEAATKYKERYANIDFGYAISSHKSQGSTYDIVVVFKDDITQVKMIGNKEKSESIYTALTRARNIAIIIYEKSEATSNFKELDLTALCNTIDEQKDVKANINPGSDN
jgi:hypothetical protein